MITARYGGRLAAIGATGLLTAAVFVLPAKAETDAKAVIKTYSDIALAKYEDLADHGAGARQARSTRCIAKPSAETLIAAREAWKASRIPYQQTEVYRFGNAIVDDWEGQVNSWPLDEGLIDYVAKSYGTESDANALYAANVIANKSIEINGKQGRRHEHHAGIPVRHAAGSRRHRGQRRHRLSRHRIPALGPGSARHRPGRRRTALRPTTISPTAPAAIATAARSI